MTATLTVQFDDDARVTLHLDGSAEVDLAGVRVLRCDLDGIVAFHSDGSMLPAPGLKDATTGRLLDGRTFDAVEGIARRRLAKARRAARNIARQHPASKDEI